MSITHEKPTREETQRFDEKYIERHPSYAMIGASRVDASPPGYALYGSDFRHQHFMTITIRRSHLRRTLSNDWHAGDDELIEVALSEAQWATFVSATNVGHGVPCTIQALNKERVPFITPITDRTAQFRGEVIDSLDDVVKRIDDIIASGKVSKKVEFELGVIKSHINSNTEFVARQFDEHMEETVEKAKSEIEAYIVSAIHNAGLEALGAKPVLQLAQPESEAE